MVADNKHSVAADKLSGSLDRTAEHSDSFGWEKCCCQSYSMVDSQKQGSSKGGRERDEHPIRNNRKTFNRKAHNVDSRQMLQGIGIEHLAAVDWSYSP